jgi:hypothetical protein
VPTLAAYFNTLDPLQRDFNDAMFNLRRAIDLFIEVCNQPGTGNPVGQATVIGALEAVNLADRQFVYLRQRLKDLIPPDREIGPDECLFTWRTSQEILKIIGLGQIVRQTFTPQDRTFGYCIDLPTAVPLAIQTLSIKGTNPAPLVVLAPFDNPTNFLVSTVASGAVQSNLIAPVTVPFNGRYLLILSATAEVVAPAEIAFVISIVPPTGVVGQLLYDPVNDVVFQTIPGVFSATPTPGFVPTGTGVVQQSAPVCPSLSYTCSQLFTCQEARACLAAGNTSLDPDGNGVPCENICAP